MAKKKTASYKKEVDGFKKILDEIYDLKTRKAKVYGNTWKIGGIDGLYTELSRKFCRIWINKHKDPKDIDFETLRDSLIDNAVYSIMTVQLIDEDDMEDKLYKLLTDQ